MNEQEEHIDGLRQEIVELKVRLESIEEALSYLSDIVNMHIYRIKG